MCCMTGTGPSNNRPAREAESLVLARSTKLTALAVPVGSLGLEGSLESPWYSFRRPTRGFPL